MAKLQISYFTPTQSACKQDGDNGPVTLAFKRMWVRRVPESTTLVSCEPVSEPHTQLLDALHTPNAGSQFGAEQASVGSFVRETPNSSESFINGSAARCRFSR
jgi:hypothetical protein